MTAAIIGITAVLLAIVGMPLFLVFAGLAVALFIMAGIDTSAVIIEISRMAASPVLIAIPLFTFAGYLLAESGTPKRLIKLTRALVGSIKGGTAIVALFVCAFFTSFSGASGVTIIALGGILYPMLIKDKYPQNFSLGLLTTSGSLGLLFPPSLLLILYGVIANVSISKLFIAGIIPGIILILLMTLWSLKQGAVLDNTEPFEWGKLASALKETAWEIPLPFVVIGGIYSGTFTASEAAILTAAYAFIIEVFIYKDLSLTRDIPRIIRSSMIVVGGIFVILGAAMGFTNYLVDEQVPMQILDWLRTYVHEKWLFLLLLNIFLILVGAVLDVFSALIVVLPLMLPIAKEFGIDPVHMAIIFLANLEIGYNAPPAGLNLFIASYRFRKPVLTLAKAALPFLAMLIIGLMLITYIPDLSLILIKIFNVQ
ncbi:MAG: C4-dicarboxylate ABC transporter [Candidatus Goldiibacteriota bacterium HGW-Goldbacteria-1]|jgi:tripartite ATP-independent transporter DctM subunit|nr:MAG: C4-dicarboxylate ABC transporter [Candidatus Goldiibacteriota bacterium HGW-Goldbacteria-1]